MKDVFIASPPDQRAGAVAVCARFAGGRAAPAREAAGLCLPPAGVLKDAFMSMSVLTAPFRTSDVS